MLPVGSIEMVALLLAPDLGSARARSSAVWASET
jgi:hypothetical protein